MRRPVPSLPTLPAALAAGLLGLSLAAGPALADNSWLPGQEAQGRFGASVADAGDLNGDGRPDLLVGAPDDDTGGLLRGRVFVFLGKPGGYAAQADLVVQGGQGGDRFGHAVAGIGDINGDGYDDFAVGAPYADGTASDAGEVRIFLGGASPDSIPARTLSGEVADDLFGWSISRGGDLDGDSYDDFLVGAPGKQAGTNQSPGYVYLFEGRSGSPTSTHGVRYAGEVAQDGFGWSVSDLPDWKGDGRAGFAVGAPFFGVDAGRAYVYVRGASGTPPTVPTTKFTGADGGDELGWSVSQLGQFGGDGKTDLAVGAPGDSGDRGRVAVYYGVAAPPATDSTPDQDIIGGTGGDRFGEAVADAGDRQGSSLVDLAVGAPLQDGGGLEAGRVYIFSGGGSYSSASQGTALAAANPSGSAVAGDHFGRALSWLGGDADGDGDDDLLIGAPSANRADGTITGVVAISGSGSGSVPVASLLMASDPLGVDRWRLRFGPVEAVSSAELRAGGPDGPLLRATGLGLVHAGGALECELHSRELAGEGELHLRWEDGDGLWREQRFAAPAALGTTLSMAPPVPNPSAGDARVSFSLPAAGMWELRLVDLRGRELRRWSGRAVAGPVELLVDGRDRDGARLAHGPYRLLLRAGGRQLAQPLTLLP